MNGYTPSYKSSDDIVMPKKNDTKIKPNEIFESSSNKKKSSVKKNEKKIIKKKNKYKK